MIKHIVLWRLKPEAHGKTATKNAQHIKALLSNLLGKIPGLTKLEVGLDFSRTHASADLALYTEFIDRAALDAYQAHPLHVEVKNYIGEATCDRWLADYEI